jgi:hypothetical protein
LAGEDDEKPIALSIFDIMTEEEYNRSINTKELQLTLAEKVGHFVIVIYSFGFASIFPIIHLSQYFNGNAKPFKSYEILIVITLVIIGFLFYGLQKKRLKFSIVHTKLKIDELERIIEKVGKDLEWIPVSHKHQSFYAITAPDFFSGSLGEKITILFNEDIVFVNSICDLDKRPQITSFGRNKKNVKCFIEAIKISESALLT